MRTLAVQALLLATLAIFSPAAASPKPQVAHLRTSAGALVTVWVAERGGEAQAARPAVAGELRFEVTDVEGRTHAGAVSAAEGAQDGSDPALAEDPISGDVYLVFGDPRGKDLDLAFSHWTGQQWSPARPLVDGPHADVQPRIAFRPDGSALLAWRRIDRGERVLLSHVELAPSGVLAVHAFVDLGDPQWLLRPVDGDVRARSGLAAVVAGSDQDAHVALVDEDADAVAVLTVPLSTHGGGSGIGASPVPVTFSSVLPQSADAPTDELGLRTMTGLVGDQRDVKHVAVDGVEGYYWVDDRVHALAFQDGELRLFRQWDAGAGVDDASGQVTALLRRLASPGRARRGGETR